MLGSMGIRTILSLVLGLMVLGTLVSFSTVGSIGDAIQQGFDQIDGQTDFTTEIDDVETLSDLTLFVRHRAMNGGCKIVEDKNSNGGYEGLEGTRLTKTPDCYGADASIIRGTDASPIGGADDNYMPGIYSREKFEITSNITIDTVNGNSWIETGDKGLNGVIAGSPSYVETEYGDDGSLTLTEAGAIAGSIVGAPAGPPGAIAGAAIFGTVGAVIEEVQPTEHSDVLIFFEGDPEELRDRANVDRLEQLNDHQIILNLCEGDKGYIQGSREEVDNNSGTASGEPLFPIIVIEEFGDSCGNNAGRASLVPDETKTSGRMLHVLSDTTEDYPYIGSHLNPRHRVGDIRDYSFHFKDFNEDQDIDRPLWGTSIQYNYNSDRSDKCVIAMYDHTPATHDSLGWVAIDQGHKIDYNDAFPPRSHPDVAEENLGHQETRSQPLQSPRSARNLYDMFADDFSGLDGGFDTGRESWDARSTELFYDTHAGEEQFAPYGDILCGEHENNNDFNDYHSQWYMCSSNYIGDEIEAGGDTWTCRSDGEWTRSSISNPTCEQDETLCNENTDYAYCIPDEYGCGGL